MIVSQVSCDESPQRRLPPALLPGAAVFVVRKSYNTQKAQVTRESCAFLYAYLVFLLSDKIFEFNSCILALFGEKQVLNLRHILFAR